MESPRPSGFPSSNHHNTSLLRRLRISPTLPLSQCMGDWKIYAEWLLTATTTRPERGRPALTLIYRLQLPVHRFVSSRDSKPRSHRLLPGHRLSPSAPERLGYLEEIQLAVSQAGDGGSFFFWLASNNGRGRMNVQSDRAAHDGSA